MGKVKSPLYIDVSAVTRRRMQAVQRENTAPEMMIRRLLHAMGYRFRLHVKKLPGTPDIVLPKYKKVVLVHGCFWHGHMDCRRSKLPANNSATWRAKIVSNQARDLRNTSALNDLGWNVLVVWECEARDQIALVECLKEFLASD